MLRFKFQIGDRVILTGDHQYTGRTGEVIDRRVESMVFNRDKLYAMYDIAIEKSINDAVTHAGEDYMRPCPSAREMRWWEDDKWSSGETVAHAGLRSRCRKA